MTFRPFTEENAIQSVAFAITFDRPVEQPDIEKLAMNLHESHAGLPAVSMIESDDQAGMEFSYKRPDGSSIWALKLINGLIHVECTRYTRWEKIWPTAAKHIRSAVDALVSHNKEADLKSHSQSCSLDVTDLFVVEENGSANEILKDSGLLPAFIFSKSRAWHCNLGWFEEQDANRTILNQINVSSKKEGLKDHQKDEFINRWVVQIKHRQEFRTDPIEISNFSDGLDDVMAGLHNGNKELLSSILSERAQESISLHGRG